ncbi:MAG: phosphoribosyltransferase [Devosia sp.]|nr:phosphoribosyltransferase [Devosia sp.]
MSTTQQPSPQPPLAPHEYWQGVSPPGTFATPSAGYSGFYPAELPDGRQLQLPIRVLPGDGTAAVASLILNQASFALEDALSAVVADLISPFAPDIVIGVPTLGLPLANNVARRLGHSRMVALGTSRKFWYRDELGEPLASITSPGGGKTIYLDPRMLPLLEGRRIIVIDDVVSTGSSMAAVLRLLAKAGIAPLAVAVAMLQGDSWRDRLAPFEVPVLGAIASPRLHRVDDNRWLPADPPPP